MDRIKANIKKFLSKCGFEKIKGYQMRNIQKNYYLVARVYKENNFTYLDEEKSKKTGVDYYVNTELPFYDILITVSQLQNRTDLDYEDPRCSVCNMSLTPKENWVRANEQSEERIISEMKSAFEKVCICPLFSKSNADFSVYEYVIWMYKIQGVYLNYPPMLWFADLAVDSKRYAEALGWLNRIVFDCCGELKATEFKSIQVNIDYSISREEKNLVNDVSYLDYFSKFIKDDSNFDDIEIREHIRQIYYSIIECL